MLFLCRMAGEEFIMITLDTGNFFFPLSMPIFIGFAHILLFANTCLVVVYYLKHKTSLTILIWTFTMECEEAETKTGRCMFFFCPDKGSCFTLSEAKSFDSPRPIHLFKSKPQPSFYGDQLAGHIVYNFKLFVPK